jgi:hypothetical protein
MEEIRRRFMAKNTTPWAFATIAVASSTLMGCEAVKAIFKAGVWVGVIGVALVLMLILGLARMLRGS